MKFAHNGIVYLSGPNALMIVFARSDGTRVNWPSLWHIDYSSHWAASVSFRAGETVGWQLRAFAGSEPRARYASNWSYSVNADPFESFSPPELLLAQAAVERDADSSVIPCVRNDTQPVVLTWKRFLSPFKVGMAADSAGGRAQTHCALNFPARETRLTVNGKIARGMPIPEPYGDRDVTSNGLAWEKSWTRSDVPLDSTPRLYSFATCSPSIDLTG